MIKFKSKILLGIVFAFVIMTFTSSFTYAGLFSDTDALEQKINEQYTSTGKLKLSELDYTSTTWGTYKAALTNAINTKNDFWATQGEVNRALANLNNAIKGLVFAGQADLDAAKALAKTKKSVDYTAVSWKVLTDALAMSETTNTEVVSKTTAINNAIGKLVFAGKADLDAAKVLANGKIEADYTPKTWKAVTDALAMLERTNTEVVAKTKAINNAIKGLVFAGQADLGAAKALANAKIEVDYTAISWKVLTDALAMKEVTNANVVTKTTAINNAITGLVFAGKADLDAAKANVVSKGALDYTVESWQLLVNALVMPETTNGEIVAKTAAINNALDKLVFAGQADLDAAKSNANSKKEEDYTAVTWKALTDALAMPETTNTEVVSKTTSINDAIGKLVFAGKANLDAAKARANQKKEKDYTAATWKILVDAKAMPEATNGEIVAKTKAMNDAITGLVFAGKADLDDAKLAANSKKEEDYTTETWKLLVDALALKENTNNRIVAKTKAINDAIIGLVFAGKADLEAAKLLANGKQEVDYTATSWQALAEVLLMPETTNSELVAKTKAMNDAITGLVFAGKADLDDAKLAANSKKQADYTVTSYKALADALLMDEGTNAEVVAKTVAINNALKGLVFAGKANLDAAKANANTKKQVTYTVESWKVLVDALLMKETTNAEVVAKTVAINNAIAGLKIMPVKYRVMPYAGLNCRVSPNINSKRVLAYRYGNIIEITDVVNGWGKTRDGWVCMDYVSKFIPPVPLALKYKVTPYIGLNCRAGADISATKITAYKYGTMLELFKIMNGWGKTSIGWVSMKYLKNI